MSPTRLTKKQLLCVLLEVDDVKEVPEDIDIEYHFFNTEEKGATVVAYIGRRFKNRS